MSRRPLSFAEKFLFIGSGFLCLATVGVSKFYIYQNELAPLPIVHREIPNPNAFDAVINAINIAPSPPGKIFNRDNCRSWDIDREFTCDGPFALNQPQAYSANYNRAFPLARKSTYLNQARPALIQWRQSLKTPFYAPKSQFDGMWYMRWTLEAAARTMARAKWQNHRTGEALEWLLTWHHHACRDATTYYNGKTHSSGVFTLQSSVSKRRLILNELELLAPHLNSKQMRHAALELQRHRTLLPSRVEALAATKNQTLELAQRVCIQNDLNLVYKGSNFGRTKLLRFRWANKKAGIERIEKQWQWVMNQERQGLPPLGMPRSLYMDSDDPFSEFGQYTDFASSRQNAAIETREVIFISAMATRAFALENGRNPRNLKELVTHYLTKTEFDPYNPTHQLIYAPHPKSYTSAKPIFTLPLPKDAIPITPYMREKNSSGGSSLYETIPPDSGRVSFQRTHPKPTGYLINSRPEELPFLLYSVGPNKWDEGGIDTTFDAFKKSPDELTSDSPLVDDILARPQFFRSE